MSFAKIKKSWALKARTYQLTGEATPPLRQVRSKHTYDNHLLYFDEDSKENKELRFATGSKSPFKDEQGDGHVRVEHIFFREGFLFTGREDVALQQFLEIHPDNGRIFEELKPEKDAEEEVIDFETRATAYEIVKNLSSDEVASFMYNEVGDEVFKTSSKELKRDLYVVADEDPDYLVEVAKDINIPLKYLAAKAVKFNVLSLRDDNRTVIWTKSKKKLTSVSDDNTPYTALAEFFLTDDGVKAKNQVETLLKDFE